MLYYPHSLLLAGPDNPIKIPEPTFDPADVFAALEKRCILIHQTAGLLADK